MKTRAAFEAEDLTQIMPDTCDIEARTVAGHDSARNEIYTWAVETDDQQCRLEVILDSERERFQDQPTRLRDAEYRLYLEGGVTIAEETNRVIINSILYSVVYVTPGQDIDSEYEIEVWLVRSK